MTTPELPPCLRPTLKATDEQIAAYVVELCEEIRNAISDPSLDLSRQDRAKLDQMFEAIMAEARKHVEAPEAPIP